MTYAAAINAMPDVLSVFGDDWNDPAVEDIFVIRPGEFFARRGGVTELRKAPELDALAIEAIGALAGHMRGQYADEDKPILDCELPSGERLSLILPPVTPAGRPSIALRRGMATLADLDWLDEQGLWDRIKERVEGQSTDYHAHRMEYARGLFNSGKITQLFKFAVQNRWTICLVGETGSGKTLNMSAMIMEIPQTPNERIITVGDSEELRKLPHPNILSLLYSKGDERITAEMLIEAGLRNLPRWVLVQELRDGAAFAFLRGLIVSPGMTTWHAMSIKHAFDALMVMIMMHPAGKAIPIDHLKQMMGTLINLVVHVERDPVTKKFRATDIKFGSELA